MDTRFKYPKTPHLPWSRSVQADDAQLVNVGAFEGREVVVTEKLDGENTTLYPGGLHARSLDPRPHASRDWVKGLHGRVGHLIPAGWRMCGENMYALHSIAYDALESYFYLFSVWDDQNVCQSWDETLRWAARLGVPTPPELYRGVWDAAALASLSMDPQRQEGYVVRLAESFAYADFEGSVAKYVRPKHVQTDAHWMSRPVVPNRLRK